MWLLFLWRAWALTCSHPLPTTPFQLPAGHWLRFIIHVWPITRHLQAHIWWCGIPSKAFCSSTAFCVRPWVESSPTLGLGMIPKRFFGVHICVCVSHMSDEQPQGFGAKSLPPSQELPTALANPAHAATNCYTMITSTYTSLYPSSPSSNISAVSGCEVCSIGHIIYCMFSPMEANTPTWCTCNSSKEGRAMRLAFLFWASDCFCSSVLAAKSKLLPSANEPQLHVLDGKWGAVIVAPSQERWGTLGRSGARYRSHRSLRATYDIRSPCSG